MARGNDKATGLLIIVGFVVFIIVKIFEFIMENIVIIGVIIGIALLIFAIVKYFNHVEEISEKERNIQIAVLKGMNQKYEQEKRQIIRSKENLSMKLDAIDSDLDKPKFAKYDSDNQYDPVEAISNLKNILKKQSLENSQVWNVMYDKTEFNIVNPKAEFDKKIQYLGLVKEPEYFELINYDSVKKKNQKEKIEQKKNDYNNDLKRVYDSHSQTINRRIKKLTEKYGIKGENWTKEFENFVNNQKQRNQEIDLLKTKYFEKEKRAIISYYSKILDSIEYDRNFHKSINIDFNIENKILIIEYLLPSIEQFPNVKEFRYIKTRNEFKEINFSQRELNNLYDDIIYRIVLDLISLSFSIDLINSVKSIVFNGWSNSINKATGLYNKACILSVVCDKLEFLKINLSEVEPKECFKSLKGVSAHKISNLTPIKPIISIENNDKRFVSSQEIGIDSSTNLASMHWEDFEHLIREIFEQEFRSNGGEVKVTQSSRDGGVDAIAFDPDPIRGGKIVIQAKRYTNIVGVSAVRDLYGTVMNEGATKGILVTTSDYGSDSFKFAKDKPITLINGGNLLFLLEKHGYKARINIKEAREELK